MSTSIHNSTDYVDIPSRSINGMPPKADKRNVDICLREESIREFWIAAIRAIQSDMYGDVDGRVYASIDIDVYLGPYDVTIRHNYKWEAQRGGDSYCGIWEPYEVLHESFEATGAFDYDSNQSLPGVVYVLNKYYKEHEIEIFNKANKTNN